MRFKLRSYTARDFETLFELDQLCYAPEMAYSRREMQAYLKFPGAECVISETRRRKIAGFCLAARKAHLGYVITMDVLPQYRRRGLATSLIAEIERRLAAAKVSEVWLETATDNQPAIAFWQKCGYRKCGTRKGYYPGGRDAHSMRKVLETAPEAAVN